MKSAFAVEIDEQLVRQAQAGDRGALFEIYVAFEKPVYTLAYRFCQCPQQARDILQDAMLSLVENIGQYRFEAPFWGWARKVFINAALMNLRRNNSRMDNVEVLVDDHAIGDSSSAEMARDIASAFSRLAPERRVVLWLYGVEGYTHQEIASMLGYSESYSKTQLMRARRQVRQWWQSGDRERARCDEGQGGVVNGSIQGDICDDQQ
ncbi:MAG: sigma-70 family RNA polymerase sigma factor [Porticoccaceae bacterium]|nr:sigma-70 family RNA polymerase sigma factor [Porticoccaceae bacterium]